VTELYSIKDVSRIFALEPSRLRYWMQTGFVGPSVRKGGRFYFTFPDLVAVKTARDLLAAGLTMQQVRRNLDSLRKALPGDANPAARLRICSDGETVVALADDVAFEPRTGQVVMAFNLPGLAGQVADVLALRPANDAVPQAVEAEPTEQHGELTAYRLFVEACGCEDRGDLEGAEHLYRQALDLQATLAAALTNLGNLLYRRGDAAGARRLYEQALERDPAQIEARYNLGNILDDLGDTDLAIAELRRVTAAAPAFADAHYNLGLLLARVGGRTQARASLERYLALDDAGVWADRARQVLTTLAA
jgi:tetratricopeptide (TPR) repeat protein